MRLKAGSHPTGGCASVVTAGDDTFESILATATSGHSCGAITEMMSAWALKAAPAPVRPPVMPESGGNRLRQLQQSPAGTGEEIPPKRRANSPMMTVTISHSPCQGEGWLARTAPLAMVNVG